jgi:hypothetical protein
MKLFLIGLVCSTLWAEPLPVPENAPGAWPPLEVSGSKIVSGFESVSHAVRLIERGVPYVAAIETSAAVEASPGDTFVDIFNNLGHQLDAQIQAAQNNQEASLAEARRITSFRAGLLAGEQKPASQSTPATPATNAVEPFGPDGYAKFQECAGRAIPLLYSKLAALIAGQAFEAVAVDAVLLPERGNGKQIDLEGMACGRYLGEHGLTAVNTTQEIQILTTLQKISLTENRVWNAFRLYSRTVKDLRVSAPLFWQFAWARLSFQKVFKKGPAFSLDQLKDQYRAMVKTGKVRLTQNLETLVADIRADVEFVK